MIIHKVQILKFSQMQKIKSGSFLKPLKIDRQDDMITLWYMTNYSAENNSTVYYLCKIWTGVPFYLRDNDQYAGTYEDGLVYHIFVMEDDEGSRQIFDVLGVKE